MSRKLPKATEHTFEELQRESSPTPKTTSRRTPKATKAKAKPKSSARPKAETAEPVRRTSPPKQSKPQEQAQAPTDTVARLRLSQAREIVERHTTYSAIGGMIPFSLLDTLSVVGVIVKMVQGLADLYEVPFHRDRTRAVVAGILGGLGQAGAGAATTLSLMKVVPGAQVVSMAVSSIASAALTRALGRAFILHFETGGTALEFDPVTLQAFFEREHARR